MSTDRKTVSLHVALECVPYGNLMNGEWWFHEGRFHIAGGKDDPDLLHPHEKVWVQVPRGQKDLKAFETAKAAEEAVKAYRQAQ